MLNGDLLCMHCSASKDRHGVKAPKLFTRKFKGYEIKMLSILQRSHTFDIPNPAIHFESHC